MGLVLPLPRRARQSRSRSPFEDCPLRFWKDTSGRYLDRATVPHGLLKDGKTPELDGFTARNGRTYRGIIEVDRDEWKLKVRSAGWNEESRQRHRPSTTSTTEPLGDCPLGAGSQVIETPTEFICARDLESPRRSSTRPEAPKHEERPRSARPREARAQGDREAPEPCGFVLPRTVCKREITRDEALPLPEATARPSC